MELPSRIHFRSRESPPEPAIVFIFAPDTLGSGAQTKCSDEVWTRKAQDLILHETDRHLQDSSGL